jgi:hypothetical protein
MTLSAVTTSVDLLHPSTFVFFLVPLIYSSKIRHVVDNQQFIRTRPSSPLRANCKSSNQHGRNHSNQRRMLLSLLDRASQPWAQRMVTLQGSRKPKTLPSTTFFKFPLASKDTDEPDCNFTCYLQPRSSTTSKHRIAGLCWNITRLARAHRGSPSEYCECTFRDLRDGVKCEKGGRWYCRLHTWLAAKQVRRWMRWHDEWCRCSCFDTYLHE